MSTDTPQPRVPKSSDPTSAVDPSPVGGAPGSRGRRPPSSAAGPLPEHVGAYRILRELGHGGMGVVYLATRDDLAMNRLVALKLVHRGMAASGVLERFERERQVLAALNHPNIARLLDGGTSERGEPFFVMEYVEGRPIDEYCDARRLTLAERLLLFRSVCAAVHHAHQNLVVHRDIKPRNILVTSEGVPKLLDFGIAKLLNPSMAPSLEAPTQTGLRLMTPEYASPEQVRGLPVTTATDVYSLGVVLFELLTGHRPYRLRTRVYHEVERIICEEEPQKPSTAITRVEEIDDETIDDDGAPPASGGGDGADAKSHSGSRTLITPEDVGRARRERPPRLRRALEGDLDNIVLMALRKEPQRRYASAEQFADDIRRHLEGHTVIARADTPGYRAAKFIRRHRGAVGAAALTLAALVVGLATTWWQWQRAERRGHELAIALADVQAERVAKAMQAEQTWHLARSMLSDGFDLVKPLKGSAAAQRYLAETSLARLEQLSDVLGPDDAAALREDIAEAWHLRGNALGGRRGENEGNLDAAAASHEAGRAIRAALVDESPDDPARRRRLATSILMLADVARQREGVQHRAEALALALEAQEHAERAVKSSDAAQAAGAAPARQASAPPAQAGQATAPAATGAEERAVLAAVLETIADLRFQCGDPEAAMLAAERSMALRTALAAARPNDDEARRELTSGQFRLAWLARDAKRYADALRLGRAIVRDREAIAAKDSNVNNATAQRDLVTARIMLSDLLREVADQGPGEAAAADGGGAVVGAAGQAPASAPGVASGVVVGSRVELEEALAQANAALALAEELAAPSVSAGAATPATGSSSVPGSTSSGSSSSPGSSQVAPLVRARADRGLCHEKVARAQLKLGDVTDAIPHLRSAIADAEAGLHDVPPRALLAREKVAAAAARELLADALETTDLAESIEQLRAAVTLRRELAKEKAAEDPGVLRAEANLGLRLVAAGKLGEGRATVRDVLERYAKVASKSSTPLDPRIEALRRQLDQALR